MAEGELAVRGARAGCITGRDRVRERGKRFECWESSRRRECRGEFGNRAAVGWQDNNELSKKKRSETERENGKLN